MKYTGPKNKLCRREGVNLFGAAKYDPKKNRKLPGQHGANMPRLSEFGKLLRNKQILKRMYLLSEKQFSKIVNETSSRFAKNKGQDHDKTLIQFLESRMDAMVLRAGFAKSIMQARQMVTHGHLLLNGKKHNIPSTVIKPGDVINVKQQLKNSPLYSAVQGSHHLPSWLKVDMNGLEVTMLQAPGAEDFKAPVDVLKVIEFYARA